MFWKTSYSGVHLYFQQGLNHLLSVFLLSALLSLTPPLSLSLLVLFPYTNTLLHGMKVEGRCERDSASRRGRRWQRCATQMPGHHVKESVCAFVCLHMCMRICSCVYVFVCLSVYTCVCVSVYVHTCICAYAHVNVFMCRCLHAHVCAHMCHLYVCSCVCVYMMCSCVCVCVCKYVYTVCVCVSM